MGAYFLPELCALCEWKVAKKAQKNPRFSGVKRYGYFPGRRGKETTKKKPPTKKPKRPKAPKGYFPAPRTPSPRNESGFSVLPQPAEPASVQRRARRRGRGRSRGRGRALPGPPGATRPGPCLAAALAATLAVCGCLWQRHMKDFIECEDREQRQKAEGGGCSLCSRGGMRKC